MENKKNKWILSLLFLGVLMGALDISIVGPAIPAIETTIKTERQQLQWIFSIYILANLTGISLMARLSDLFGRRKIYVLSLFIFSAGSLIVALSHDMNILLAGRAVQGFGASGIFPVASATVGDIFPPEKRGRVLGLIGMVFGIAFILGPVIAGIVLKYFIWNDLFFINIPIAILLIYGSIRLLPNVPVKNISTVDWKGVSLLAILLASFAFGINGIKADSLADSIMSVRVLPFLLLSLISLFLLIRAESGNPMPVVNTRLFLVRQIRLTGLIAVGTGLFQASFVFLPKLAVATFSVSASQASFMLMPVVIATTIGSPVSGRLLDELGSRTLIVSGLLLCASGFLAIGLTGSEKLLFYGGGALIGLGFSILSGSALRYVMLNEVKEGERASTQGIVTIFISIGQISGAAVMGVILASFASLLRGFKMSFLIISFVAVLLAFAGFFLKSRKDEKLSMNQAG